MSYFKVGDRVRVVGKDKYGITEDNYSYLVGKVGWVLCYFGGHYVIDFKENIYGAELHDCNCRLSKNTGRFIRKDSSALVLASKPNYSEYERLLG